MASQKAYNRAQITKAKANLNVIERAFDEGIKAAGEDVGKMAVAALRTMLSAPWPPASSPGEPPRRRSGELQARYDYVVGGRKGHRYVDVGSPTFYAPYLEYGTRHMAPRPHLRIVAAGLVATVPPMVATQVEAHLRAAGAAMAR